MQIFVTRIDDNRDRLFCDRLEALLRETGKGDVLAPFLERRATVARLGKEDEQALTSSDALVCLYSPEAADSARVRLELHFASTLGKPGVLLRFPGVRLPAWAERPGTVIELEGFKDSGPGLPPGTDEWEILRGSTFVRVTLAAIARFLDGVRDGRAPRLPPVPPPSAQPRRFLP